MLSAYPPLLLILGVAADLDSLRLLNSWTRDLAGDPDQELYHPNQQPRGVASGHFVFVQPTPLRNPAFVAHSPEVAHLLGLDPTDHKTNRFAQVFSGDLGEGPFRPGSTWATPYALSIYGHEHLPSGSGPLGNGYGDGRAVTLGEVVGLGAQRLEVQLKGAGRTPFCRGADGRAVLRSSVREFLASEAMANLGVPSTRALSLVASHVEVVARPWYSSSSGGDKRSSPEKHGGDIVQHEHTAITTRVASSYIRVGSFELYSRRAQRAPLEPQRQLAKRQLADLVRHTVQREFFSGTSLHNSSDMLPQIAVAGTMTSDVVLLAEGAAERLAFLAAEWIRVGFVQSNFNSDNCHVAGLTLDFGPFGFVERYDPGFAMWISSGEHFAFFNQPKAAGQNFLALVKALRVLLVSSSVDTREEITSKAKARKRLTQLTILFDRLSSTALQAALAAKLGLGPKPSGPQQHPSTLFTSEIDVDKFHFPHIDKVPKMWATLDSLLRETGVDWTIFWRQLTYVVGSSEPVDTTEALSLIAESFFPAGDHRNSKEKDSHSGCTLWAAQGECAKNPGYMQQSCAAACFSYSVSHTRALNQLDDENNGRLQDAWLDWLAEFMELVGPDASTMLTANPKYVPREWMLVAAYEEAGRELNAMATNETPTFLEIKRLQELFRAPYDEQSEDFQDRYYRLPPSGTEKQGGVGFMS